MSSGSSGVDLQPVLNVFYFVADLPQAVDWYTRLLGRAPKRPMSQLATFALGPATLTLHEVDEYNAAAPAAGAVAYWTVSDVDSAVAEAIALGGVAHRGPKTVFNGDRLCQVLDPFGNLLGLRQAGTTSSRPGSSS
jgi:catechol 2,3-dioxygenase-like lactoylglutathione lyase family enzyme